MKKQTNTTLNALVIPVMSGQFGFILRAGNQNRHEELTMFFFFFDRETMEVLTLAITGGEMIVF